MHDVDLEVPSPLIASAAFASAARASTLHGTQNRGLTPARLLVGKDVVDVVAAASRRQAAYVGALAVAVFEGELGSRVGVVVVGVVNFLGQAEVDERAMPGVPEGHVQGVVRVTGC